HSNPTGLPPGVLNGPVPDLSRSRPNDEIAALRRSVGAVVLQHAGQFGEGVEFEVGGAGLVGDVGPGAALDERGVQADGGGGADVVVEAVADVQDFGGLVAAGLDQTGEEGRVGFGGLPVVGGGKEVAGKVQFAEEPASAGGLVAGEAHEVAGFAQGL